MRPIGIFAVSLALVSTEPVETIVTQGPNGTAVTRLILTPEPGVSTYMAPPLAYPPPVAYPPVAAEAQYEEPAPTVTTRRVSTSRVTTAPARTRTARHESTRTAVRTVTRTVTAPSEQTLVRQPLVLSPSQRQVIYRSVVQRDFYPAPARPPLVTQTDVYAPPPMSGYPLRTVYPADETYSPGYRDYAYSPDPYRDYDYRDPYHTAYRWDGVPLVVGARIPASVPLVPVPQPVVARIPAAEPYSYAVLDNRVYLVDPSTGIIVAEITP
jgi:hypothetical protein